MTLYQRAKWAQRGHMRAAQLSKKSGSPQRRHYVERALFYRSLAKCYMRPTK